MTLEPVPPFVSSEGAHGDFLLSRRKVPGMAAFARGKGGQSLETEHWSLYAFGFPARIRPDDTLLSGTYAVDGSFGSGPTPTARLPGGMGNWWRLTLGTDRATVTTDDFGMCKVFAGRGLVSNRLHLIREALERADALRFDLAAAKAGLYSSSSFSEGLSTFRTHLHGVRLLRAGQGIDSHGETVASPLALEPGRIDESEYHALVEKGAAEIVDNVGAALDRHGAVQVAITGGRDSRILLAALVAMDRVGDVRFTTQPRGLDVPIATGLVKTYGGRYGGVGTPGGTRHIPIGIGLRRFESLTYGTHNHYPRSIRKTLFGQSQAPYLYLGGGCGEIYRKFYQSSAFKAVEKAARATEGTLREMVLAGGSTARRLDEAHMESVLEPMLETMTSLPGRNLSERMDAHYLEFRNRTHFGTPLGLGGGVGWTPLLSRSLLRAAWGLPWKAKRSGRVVFDVTRALCERLAYTAYDSASTDFSRVPYHRPGPLDGQVLPVEPAPEILRVPPAGPVEAGPTVPKVDFDAVIAGRLEAEFVRLRELGLAGYASDDVVRYVAALRAKGSLGRVQNWETVLRRLRRIAEDGRVAE